MKKILILDNYDSFTYNLFQLCKKNTDVKIEVHRNDKIKIEECDSFDKILLSPGPGIPNESGILTDVIRTYADYKSILGVCLGFQAIAEVFGARLVNLLNVYHGVATNINITDPHYLFKNIPLKIQAGRYHSWCVSRENFPDALDIIADDDENNIMALRHKYYDVSGVQFHPESILTPYGMEIIKNWIEQ